MKGLIHKLIKLNFPPFLVNAIQSYLRNRTIAVHLENDYSFRAVRAGVLQDLFLESILLTYFIPI